MFTSCPHCRELVATDRQTLLPPALCPRCGGEMQEPETLSPAVDTAPPAAGRSFVSFLQPTETDSVESPNTRPLAAPETRVAVTTPESEPVVATTENVLLESSFAETNAAGENHDSITDPTAAEVLDKSPAEVAAGINPDELTVATEPAKMERTFFQPAPPVSSPSFTRQPASITTHPRTAKWQWVTLVVLSLLLILQVLIADRARLAADENWRPVITHLCDALGCSVPAWHQPGAFAMLSRDVRPIAGVPGGLQVQVTFRNDAQWAQAWPLLLLALSDADGRVVGSRAFTPAEYLGKAATQPALAPGQSAGIAVQLHEPNPDVVAFSFDFR